jgi:hypothetical protein
MEMLRPEPAPHTYPGVLGRDLTARQSVFFDWEHRAHRGLVDATDVNVEGEWIRVPEYTLVESYSELPEQDKDRLLMLIHRVDDHINEFLEEYGDVYTPSGDIFGDDQGRISEHLGYMLRSIQWCMNEVGLEKPRDLLESEEKVHHLTRSLIRCEDYLAVTNDFIRWSKRDCAQYPELTERIITSTGALRQAIEAIRALVIRHPEYDLEEWERVGLEEVPFE